MSKLKFKSSPGYSVIIVLTVIGIVLADGPAGQKEVVNTIESPLIANESIASVPSGVQASNDSKQQVADRKLEVTFNDQQDTFDADVKENSFDMDRFLEEFDNIDCSRNQESLINQENSLCENKLEDLTLAPLGISNSGKDEVFEYLNDQIYQPLAFEPKKKESLSDMILGVLDLKEKKINDRGLSLGNFGGFQKSVMSTFSEIAAQSENVKDNENGIRDSSVDLLKKFHIYWNLMRSQGQIERVKEDTKQVMQSLLMTYQVKRDFQNFVLKTLVKSIVKAYYRFIKAYKMVEIISRKGHNMIAQQMVARYKAMADLYLPKNNKRNSLARDIANFIYMLESLYMVSYKQGLDDTAMIGIFENQVVKVIQDLYLEYEDKLNGDEENDRRIIEIRNFTAALLLKMKHQTYIIFNLNGINEFVNHSGINYINHPILVRLYYDLYDNFITVPRTCVSFLLLKHCYVYEITRTFRYLLGKYLLSRSTMGCRLYDIVSSLVKSISTKADSTVWENWGLFKQYYYENLFSVLETFRSTYHINSMDSIENLENMIVAEMDKFREEQSLEGIPGIISNLLERLDKSLYSEFIAIKADFNQFAPVERDQRILAMLSVRLRKFFETFQKSATGKAQSQIAELTIRLNKIIEQWTKTASKLPEVSYNIGNPALAPTVQNVNMIKTLSGESLVDASHEISPEYQQILESPIKLNSERSLTGESNPNQPTLTGRKANANLISVTDASTLEHDNTAEELRAAEDNRSEQKTIDDA